jgi:recombinational DNA repair ATPase RecF
VALVKLAEWSAVAKAAGHPPLFAADDFDAGLSEGWVGEFFDALPVDTQVLLTTAAPASRWARRASATLEMTQGRATPTRTLRVVRQDAEIVEA